MAGYFISFVNYIWKLFKNDEQTKQEKRPIHSISPRRLSSDTENRSIRDGIQRTPSIRANLKTPDPKANEQNPDGIAWMVIPADLDDFQAQGADENDVNLDLSKQGTPLCRPVYAMFPPTRSPRPNRSRTDLRLRRCFSMDLRPYLQNDRGKKFSPWLRARELERPTTAPEDTYNDSRRSKDPAIETVLPGNCSTLLTTPDNKDQPSISQFFTPTKSEYFTPPKIKQPSPKESKIPIRSARRHSVDGAKRPVKTPIRTGRFQHTCCGGVRDRRHSGHRTTQNTIPAAHRCFLDTRLDEMFRQMSKKKYCGNIIDSASHCRWMRLAGIFQDKDGHCFKSFAKGRVVLTVSEYKSALHKMCQEHDLDYWEVLRKMACVTTRVGDGSSMKYRWNESVNCK